MADILEAAKALIHAMETCHHCQDQIIVEPEQGGVHCEKCSWDCDDHPEPECSTVNGLHARLKRLLIQAKVY